MKTDRAEDRRSTTKRQLRVLLLLAWLVQSCAPSVAIPFARSSAEAERAYAAGHYEEAAHRWQEAGNVADNHHDREEASYREALCFLKLGDLERAKPLLLALERVGGERGARAAYDLALAEIERGDKRDQSQLLQVAERFPSSAAGRTAFRRYIAWFAETHERLSLLGELERLLTKFHGTAVDEEAQYSLARTLEANGATEVALNRYLELAAAHPYPKGGYWDDALWHASLLEEKLGHAKKAVEHLERMLRARETSNFMGSYERPRYDEAQFRIALLRRDTLNDWQGAERAFRKLWSDFPTSRLRDDALWELARLKLSRGDQAGACSDIATLSRRIPESRFVPCAYLLCPKQQKLPRPCGDYIVREITGDIKPP